MVKIRALQEGIHPQVGMLLLRLCCMPLLNYLQVVPPSLVAEHFASFDAQVANFVLLLLTLPGRARSLPCAEDRMRAFRRRLRPPIRHKGAGLIGVDSISAAAFVGSVVAAAHADLVVPKLQQRWSRSVHEAAWSTLGPEEQTLGDCDFVHSQARARPTAIVLQLPLSHRFSASRHSSSSRGSASSSASPSWPASPTPTPRGSSCASLPTGRGTGTWTSTATTRTPAFARPRCVAEAIAIGA